MDVKKIAIGPKHLAVAGVCGEIFLGAGKNFRLGLRTGFHICELGLRKMGIRILIGPF